MPQQMMHPTLGMNGAMGGGFPREGIPLSQAAVPQGMIGAPQFFGGPTPVNGMNPQTWQPMMQPQPQMMQPMMQQPAQQFIPAPQMMQPQHPTAPWGQQFEQPGYQAPRQPQFQQQPRLQVQGQEILDGPGVPLELRGRTMGQAMQIYSQLADNYLRNQRGQQQPQMQHPQQGQPQFQQPQQQQTQFQQPGQQQQQQRPTFFQSPDQAIRSAMREEMAPMLAPLQQYTQQQATQQAFQLAQQTIPDLAQLQPEMQQILRETDPQHHSNPQFWEGAADLARGRAMRRQQTGQQQGQQMMFPQPQMPAPQFFGQSGRAAPAQQGFPQPSYQFFAEGPTPPAWGQPQGGMGEFTQEQLRAMQGFGMTPDQYRAYQGGATQQQRRW